ncbi:hypothetical protein CERSUDRAFT_48325, partial [Gelatoporia subvermispora B]
LVMEDTVHYGLKDDDEWASQYPSNGGFVRLGPDNRVFSVSMFTQLRCLDTLRHAVINPPETDQEKFRAQRCFNHIRQMLLCSSNLRLETLKIINGGPGTDGLGLEHECRDWGMLYDVV